MTSEDNTFMSERFTKNNLKNNELISLMYRKNGRKYHSCNSTEIQFNVRLLHENIYLLV